MRRKATLHQPQPIKRTMLPARILISTPHLPMKELAAKMSAKGMTANESRQHMGFSYLPNSYSTSHGLGLLFDRDYPNQLKSKL